MTKNGDSPKTVLITGATTGFGRGTAEILARDGNQVFASMRDVGNKNRIHAEELRRQGLQIVELDVTDDASVERAIGEVVSKAGKIDVVVNNAGIASAGVSEAFTTDQLKQLFEVNVFGVHRVLRAVLPVLRKQQDGLVINVGSILGRVTFPFFGLYGASKFAVEAMTESYRLELSQLGIEVVLVQPSAYPTNMYASAQQPADVERSATYGSVGSIPGKMLSTFMGIFKAADAPNPLDVPDAIATIVKKPKGSRPARVIVGAPYGADVVNRQTEPVQAQLIEALGLSHLTTLRP